MTSNQNRSQDLLARYSGAFAFCLFFLTAGIASLLLFPAQSDAAFTSSETDRTFQSLTETNLNLTDFDTDAINNYYSDSYKTAVAEHAQKEDKGLALYRSVYSRPAVEWFYTHITENNNVAVAILEEADKNDIPLSLAFALAYTESRYKARAVNKNTNASIDRGLFQLNSSSFPSLKEDDFFDPAVSARYGLSHLRFCLDTAGNEIAALAMYNAGTNRVRKNGTPQMTLNYVSKIIDYRQGLDELFSTEVAQFYQNGTGPYLAAAGNGESDAYR
ncbi:transglycosylase SLT domain-containing protein [Treponema brennaborense]|uniref:Lytic transglycosylase catalytic n=1 Tax=Treponema brennaborense (strain DSM 12168 / CIP 105900 / DD5/3) TaxID=906968 RepID=F4LL55_TREBD|nr:transglycosylase SLT domain-containing protein [Treponema brennaborense]AEE17629.1 Lytic transglycosylase catalytic [Treponema brennaborense DSM 12168]